MAVTLVTDVTDVTGFPTCLSIEKKHLAVSPNPNFSSLLDKLCFLS